MEFLMRCLIPVFERYQLNDTVDIDTFLVPD